MSKLEFINNQLKNAKINNKQLKNICHCFADDLTASQTAKKLELSRQTINSYYKMIREALLEERTLINNIILKNDFSKNCFVLRYLSVHSYIIYYMECNSKTYILNNQNKTIEDIQKFLKHHVKDSLKDHKRANSARVLYNTHADEYFVASFLKSSNELEEFVNQRVKRFRGLNKNNILNHIEESMIRFDNNSIFVFNTLKRLFNF